MYENIDSKRLVLLKSEGDYYKFVIIGLSTDIKEESIKETEI